MTHQLKMELIILREKLLFETDDMPQDSQILLTNFKKISKKKNNMFEKETYICFKELESIIYDNLKIQEEIVMAKNKMEILENTTGSYGL